MTRILRIEHAPGFDLIPADQLHTDEESLGIRTVLQGSDGEAVDYHVVRRAHIVETITELPDDYEGRPIELVHLVETYQDRHFDEPIAVTGDPVVGPKIAALLGVPYNGELDELVTSQPGSPPGSAPGTSVSETGVRQ